MKNMSFGYPDCNLISKSGNPDMYDLTIRATTTNEDYIEKAKGSEKYLDSFVNEFYLTIGYNHMTKRFHPSNVRIIYVTNFGYDVEVDKIINKEDINEVINYLRLNLLGSI